MPDHWRILIIDGDRDIFCDSASSEIGAIRIARAALQIEEERKT
jgi:hypothetical protein